MRLFGRLGVALAVAGLFICYLRLARAVGTNADGAANALQAWDLLHGHVLLAHWTLSDVAFYPLELVQYSLIELITGLHPDALTAGAALTYTLLVVLTAIVARGSSKGWTGAARIALALSFLVVPAPGLGHAILLNQPDHFGTSIPLLLAWIALERGKPRWAPVLVGVFLTLGQVADPLVTLIGAVPLIVVCAARMVRARRIRGGDGALLIAGAASVPLAYGLTGLIEISGGYAKHPVPTELISVHQLGHQLALTRDSISVLFGFHFEDLHGWVDHVLAVVHIVGVALVLLAILVVFARWIRGRSVALEEVLAVAIVFNVGAFIVSTLNSDVLAAREMSPVLPMAAILTARVLVAGRPFAVPRYVRVGGVVIAAGVAALLVTTLVGQVRVPAAEPTGTAVATWLQAHHLTYGLGSYWTANTITLDTGGAVRVAPVTGTTGILAYQWESRSDWYDPARHDARFVVIDLHNPHFGTVAGAIAQFGAPTQRVTLPTSPGRTAEVLVYDHNLLVGLPASCGPGRTAVSMAAC